MAEVIPWKERVDLDLYNHGKDGIKTQLTAFITEYRTERSEREKTKKTIRWAIGTTAVVLGPSLIAFLVWLVMTVLPAAKAIIDEYYRAHPAAVVQHSLSNIPEPAYAESRPEISHY